MQIGPYELAAPLVLAPMAGITDRPFRQICRAQGAALAVGEMTSSNPRVWNTAKSRMRMDHRGEEGIRSVQIAGSEPQLIAEAAQMNVAQGAQIIDINMGCPAKKVNRKLAGSALLQQPELVEQILRAVVAAVDVPVTLKIRTGWDRNHRNGVEIAELAERCGVQALTVHGRTRADLYKGEAEYDTIGKIKQAVSIPVIANGDITSPQKARQVLQQTGADAVMIGRGAQGQPWLFAACRHYLASGELPPEPAAAARIHLMLEHVAALHEFYGEPTGVRFARKHVTWYLRALGASQAAAEQEFTTEAEFRQAFNAIESARDQLKALEQLLMHFDK